MKRYEKMRTVRQEVYYNLGRMFHQLSITPLAIHFYKLVGFVVYDLFVHEYFRR